MRFLALLFVASILLVSGCISGRVAERQAAEPPDNASSISIADYEDNAPEAATAAACDCPDSFRTCGDGFNASCENTCADGSCTRCMPTCIGHEACSESWFCGEWQPCSAGRQERRCIDSSFCNRTAVIEARACPDSCLSDADCPRGTGCSAYICRGSPKACEKVVLVPCCGDGRCEGGENSTCPSDCPAQSSQNNSQQQSPPSQNQTGDQTSNQTTYTYYTNVTITNITYKGLEFVLIENFGNGSADMTNWTLADNASHIFRFPQFILNANSSVKVHTEDGTNNDTDIFWGTSPVWNDKGGDVAYLKDKNSILISVYSYVS